MTEIQHLILFWVFVVFFVVIGIIALLAIIGVIPTEKEISPMVGRGVRSLDHRR